MPRALLVVLVTLASWTGLAGLVSFPAWEARAAAAPVPRQAPDLPLGGLAGGDARLSSYQGQVVVVEFLLTRCARCWQMAQSLTRLQQDFGARGFQALAVAIDPDLGVSGLADFASRARLPYPVSSALAADVDRFLGRRPEERFQVPQFVVIDRAGVIRAQSRPTGETYPDNEAFLHDLVGKLLAEARSAPRQ